MVFFNIGWMRHYQGQTTTDLISRGGAYIDEHGFGHEIFNFSEHRGRYYGYVQPPRGASIDLDRIRPGSKDSRIDGVDVIWTATASAAQGGGRWVVGWYLNATVFKYEQPAPLASRRAQGGKSLGWYATARRQDARLLPPHERTLRVPHGKGGMGQSNVWYADSDLGLEFRHAVVDRLGRKVRRPKRLPSETGARWIQDAKKRLAIEIAAVERVKAHFESLGYQITGDRQADKVGWDLEVSLGKRCLLVEVKGTTAAEFSVDLTPNEYAAMNAHEARYLLCVVTNALKNDSRIWVYGYDEVLEEWVTESGRLLLRDEVIGARCTSPDRYGSR